MDSTKAIFLTTLLFLTGPLFVQSGAHRNLLHWKHDLEYRLDSYLNQRDKINQILASSIHPSRVVQNVGPSRPTLLAGNVRFTDLIIPEGGLIFEQHLAKPTVRILVNRTAGYVNSKMNELYQAGSQLDIIKRQLSDPNQRFIYKGLPNVPAPPINLTTLPGTRVFKQFLYGRSIQSGHVELTFVNYTNVDQVLNATYMQNTELQLHDSKSRLYFEGKKTFWRTAFSKDLKSGCCDRMRPLHTNRMMIRRADQDVMAPIMFQSNSPFNREIVMINQLSANQMYNRFLMLGLTGNPIEDNGILPSRWENFINLGNIIHIKQPSSLAEIPKTLVFKDVLIVDEAQLYDMNPYREKRLTIGILTLPEVHVDLLQQNYLLRFSLLKNNSLIQYVPGLTIVNSKSLFVSGIGAHNVNQVQDFRRFVGQEVVRIDRPTTIFGSVQFNALPSMLGTMGPLRTPQSVSIMQVDASLNIGLINGMRIPEHLVFLPPSRLAIKPNQLITVRGPRSFANRLVFKQILEVRQLVNNIPMPQGVIPLHLNDFMSDVWASNLWFVDGISTHHLTIHSGQFDDINVRDSDAQNLIMQSVFELQPDGTHLIRAPLRIMNLRLIGRSPNQGLLNGFRPEYLLELSRVPSESVFGRRTFLSPVEADECVFNDINNLANWPQQLIRIDRPQTVQTIHSRLGFVQPVVMNVNNSFSLAGSSVSIDHFRAEFYPDDRVHHLDNWNFSPEFYIMDQALVRATNNNTGGRYRILDRIRLMNPSGGPPIVNNIPLDDIVTLDKPFRFLEQMVLVGKVNVAGDLRARHTVSNYPLDVMDLVQFDRYRIPIMGSPNAISLNNLVLSTNNQAKFVQCRMLNGISFDQFAKSIMSLTRPQDVDASLVFTSPISFQGFVKTGSSVNNLQNFAQLGNTLRTARYSFEDGLQCNSVLINT